MCCLPLLMLGCMCPAQPKPANHSAALTPLAGPTKPAPAPSACSEAEEEEECACLVCGDEEKEQRVMLECDRCLAGCHLDCMMPPLQEVPEVRSGLMACRYACPPVP
jgi:hypothetical protein